MLKSSLSQPVNLREGALVRIPAHSYGASFALPTIPRVLAEGAFGYLTGKMVNGAAQYTIKQHDLMPPDFKGLGNIKVTNGMTLEAIEVDDPNEAGILGLDYLTRLGQIIRERTSGGMNQGDDMSALIEGQLEATMSKILPALEACGMHVVEQSHVVTKTTKRVHLVIDAEAAKQRIVDGLEPEGGKVYELGKVRDESDTIEIKPITALTSALYAPVIKRVGEHSEAEQEVVVTPFMRMIAGMPQDVLLTRNGQPETAVRDDEIGLRDLGGLVGEDDSGDDERDQAFGGGMQP